MKALKKVVKRSDSRYYVFSKRDPLVFKTKKHAKLQQELYLLSENKIESFVEKRYRIDGYEDVGEIV